VPISGHQWLKKFCLPTGVGTFTVSRNLSPTASFEAGASVDSMHLTEHITAMSKKPRKVEESTAAYSAKKPANDVQAASQPGPRFADLEKVRIGNARLIKIHHKVLQKLAQ
jgi:hypothetical protein